MAAFGNLDSGGNEDGFHVYWDYANTRIIVETNSGQSAPTYAYSEAPTYVSGTAYHIAVSFDRAAGQCAVFQDGVDISSSDMPVDPDFKLRGGWRIGLDWNSSGDSWAYFDDVQVFDDSFRFHCIGVDGFHD